MEHEDAAAALAELGNRHRLAVFRYLVKAGPGGASVGELQRALNIPLSTLSHHLSRMAQVSLIRQSRHGRSIVCLPNYAHLGALLEFLQRECCAGHGHDAPVEALPAAHEGD